MSTLIGILDVGATILNKLLRGLPGALIALIVIASSTSADAKMVVNAVCKWFGTAPACSGQCPNGWTEKRRSKTGDGQRCFTGSKAYCCDFQEHCVPEVAAGWKPGAKRTRDDGVIECQQCTRWGDDCERGGSPRFNTACAHYVWEACGRTQPKRPTGGRNIGFPEQVPGTAPAKPSCDPPKILYPSGVCACPKGLTGEFCNYPVVN
jgi:hypothetical protein